MLNCFISSAMFEAQKARIVTGAATVRCSTIENYKSDKHGFDGLAALTSLGNFFTVFFGAFALGCGMGCITALVLLSVFFSNRPIDCL